MKNLMNYPRFIALVLISAFGLTSCFDPVQDDLPIYLKPGSSDLAKPEGSLVTAMNENVTISFPPGAVAEDVKITVNECDNINNCPFLMKMIRIDPMILFNAPVTVNLKCDGDLLLGNEPPEEKCPLVICYWENEEEYKNRVREKCISCYMDPETGIISFCITQTGIFALGNKENGNYN